MRRLRENTDPLVEREDHQTPDDIFRVALPYKITPFESEHWRLWKEFWQLALPPDAVREMDKQGYIARGGTARDFSLANPITQAFHNAKAVYQSWETLVKQYSPRHIHKASGFTSSYQRWKEHKKIPDNLDIQEFSFLVEWVNKSTGREVIKRFNSANYRHPVPTGEWVKIQSKVGNVYGTWRLRACVSESENTAYNPKYVAECMACGHTINSFSYSRICHPCPACAKSGRAEKRLADKDGKPLELTIWLLKDGVTVSKARPDGATAKAIQTRVDERVQWEYLEDRTPERVEQMSKLETEPATLYSEVDKRVLTLLDDMPGM
jgi:hypothetical protein